jgi:polar amino acid transport system substrate-binding protein
MTKKKDALLFLCHPGEGRGLCRGFDRHADRLRSAMRMQAHRPSSCHCADEETTLGTVLASAMRSTGDRHAIETSGEAPRLRRDDSVCNVTAVHLDRETCASKGIVMKTLLSIAALFLAGCVSPPPAVVGDIAPKGALRVAIGIGPSASPFWSTRDATSGTARGVTVELGRAAATKLGVPLQLIEYPNSGEITAAASKDAWDISFMPQDAEREKFVDVGPAYVLYESSYIVRAGSDIRASDAVDRKGTKVGVVEGTSTSRTVLKSIKNASVTVFPQASDAMDQLAKGQVDALAMGREALVDFAKKVPGTRLLPEIIQATGVVVVVPKNRPATRAWAARFLEEAKADGTVRRALDSAGFSSAPVAPPAASLRPSSTAAAESS